MLARVMSSAVIGIDAYLVEVEVDIAQGLPTFTTVGLPEAAVKESTHRVERPTSFPAFGSISNTVTLDVPQNISSRNRSTLWAS